MNLSKLKYIYWWLVVCLTLVFTMVFIGGLTRLTDSGLSMVEWNIISGIFPPILNSDWIELFDKYKNFPEYKLINKNMSLNDFKFIFWMEYIHRIWGRIIFIVFFVPLLFFLKKEFIPKKIKKHFFIILFLIIFQGGFGWYMVKSGLVNEPNVSHYRLAFHLTTAFIIYGYLLLLTFNIYDLKNKKNYNFKTDNKFYFLNILLISLIIITVFSGGMVAGLDAGLVYNTFPLMGDKFIPYEIFELSPKYLNFLENPVTVQFDHRILGTTTFLIILSIWIYSKIIKTPNNIKLRINILLIFVLLQVPLGISTLISYVYIPFAIMHQMGALILFSLSLWTLKSLPFMSK